MYRQDGSYYDESQLRNGGRFVKKRINLTLQDRVLLERSGYTAEEITVAFNTLIIELDDCIRAGEKESEILRRMKQVFDTKQNCFVDA